MRCATSWISTQLSAWISCGSGSCSNFARERAIKTNTCCGLISDGNLTMNLASGYRETTRAIAIFRSPSETGCRWRPLLNRFPIAAAAFRRRESAGWTAGHAFVIRHCRVGILNEIGELLEPRVAVLLIGERPGLATATSLSAYMAFRPTKAHTDADRNLISNIHARGVGTDEAAERILELAALMMHAKASGCRLREETRGL